MSKEKKTIWSLVQNYIKASKKHIRELRLAACCTFPRHQFPRNCRGGSVLARGAVTRRWRGVMVDKGERNENVARPWWGLLAIK